MSYYAIDMGPNSLAHHGILGMKWGIRRYQNEDGSLTSAGRVRYYGAGGDRKGYYKQKGAAKRYKDVDKYATRKVYATAALPTTLLTKGYRNWRKENPNNRGIANYANYKREQIIKEQFGNNRKALADSKYAYEHKNLARYINRDGSLTSLGKLKYWDTNAERGQRRMQRDIDRDKKMGSYSDRKAEKNYKKNIRRYKRRSNEAKITLGESALTGLGSAVKLATGRPIAATVSAARAAGQFGRAVAMKNRANRKLNKAAGNTYLGQKYGINNQGRLETQAVNKYRNEYRPKIQKAGSNVAKVAKYNYNTNMGTIKKVGSGVAKAARYSYDTNMDTVKKITRKRKRS